MSPRADVQPPRPAWVRRRVRRWVRRGRALDIGPRGVIRQGMAPKLAGGSLIEDGFAFLRGAETRAWLSRAGSLDDWDAFAASWDGMALDEYMADGGRYRRRRHAVFTATPDAAIARQPHQPHFQGRDYNALNGGVERWFEPIPPEVQRSHSFVAILAACHALFGAITPARIWRVECHQFRIEARAGEAGQPTPEGLHRDGVDFVLVLLVARRNIASGTTTVHALDRALLGEFTLTDPLDAALVDDRRVFHGVTAVRPVDTGQPAWRDVLVATFRGE